MTVKLNLNQYGTVTLMQSGADAYNQYHAQFEPRILTAKVKGGDVIKQPLWTLMQIFGPKLFMGCEIPFKDCEIIVSQVTRIQT